MPSIALSLSQMRLSSKIDNLDPSCNIDKVARAGEYAVIACQSPNTEFPFRHGIAARKMLRGRVSCTVKSRWKKDVPSRREQAKKEEARRRSCVALRCRELSYANSNRMQPVSFMTPWDSRRIKLKPGRVL